MLHPGDAVPRLIPDRARPRAFTLRVDGADQSYVDLDDPTRLDLDYVERMASFIDAAFPVTVGTDQPRGVVHIGGGGMTLPRYVAARRTGWHQVVFEPNTDLVDFVASNLPLPPSSGIEVRTLDGRTGVRSLQRGSADIAVIDAFVGLRTPAELTTTAFTAELSAALTEDALVIVNLLDRGPMLYARRVLAGLVPAFPHALICTETPTLRGHRFGNVLVVCSTRPLPTAVIARSARRARFPYRVVHGWRLRRLLRDVPPLSDAEPGPAGLRRGDADGTSGTP